MTTSGDGSGAGHSAKPYPWTAFYTAFADRLSNYCDNRGPLVSAIHDVSNSLPQPLLAEDRFVDGSAAPLRDICPFTTFAYFNRQITDDNRLAIAKGFADFLGVTEPLPGSFDAIPLVPNLNTWFFPYARIRSDDHIDTLWRVFSDAIELADDGDEAGRERFANSFDEAMSLRQVGRRLTTGLYWARPWHYPTLDRPSSTYLAQELGLEVGEGRIDAATYLDLKDRLEAIFADERSTVNSFPELSRLAYDRRREEADEPGGVVEVEEVGEPESERTQTESVDGPLYSIDDIVGDGCFLGRARLEVLVERLREKKNLILQGPPGTGKTWLAKRLAYALIGRRSQSRVRPFQFHPNLSYEDFVRGWRPEEGGGLQLVDGPFLKAVEAAAGDADNAYVLVIEEINRGNPAQIFGEMLTLLEADKRTPDEALAVSYPRGAAERIHIPSNLYVIGTMNVADRSLALVDFALRRRFAFVDLEPTFGEAWRTWVSEQCGIEEAFLRDVERRLNALNEAIATDAVLGPHFQVGHSVVTPPPGVGIQNPHQWFRRVVETEVTPLLGEYWFDEPKRAEDEGEKLLRGLTP